ncbi:hypothetical protein [Pseudovibrio brasiliensis]|uniref:Uncharacterized protein n=1 Tax=Pseudovibrio brasiliensis TaxID=1898042 RepID=A0ABX8AVP4_9HYPH|nr:hypothetical protein [Pseudovibrio brasiliensis]QUS57341.1 hypothetical protein KGB56_08110 [Pseudovibrio brasiliensis]
MSEQKFPVEFDRSVTLSEKEAIAAQKLALLLAGLGAVKDEKRDWLAVSTPQPTPQLHALTLMLSCETALVVLGFAKGESVEEIGACHTLGASRKEVLDALHAGLVLAHEVLIECASDAAVPHRMAKLQDYIGRIQIAA